MYDICVFLHKHRYLCFHTPTRALTQSIRITAYFLKAKKHGIYYYIGVYIQQNNVVCYVFKIMLIIIIIQVLRVGLCVLYTCLKSEVLYVQQQLVYGQLF